VDFTQFSEAVKEVGPYWAVAPTTP
jgi:hypothetical protein